MTGGHCFTSGGRIRAARGDVPVESILVGEQVVVIRDGQQVLEPVVWMGHAYVDPARQRYIEDVAPVRVRKDAIAPNQPQRDLILSPEHCLIIDGLCVPVKLLVNGGSIAKLLDHPPLTYYHIQLEKHGILLAENAPAESYLDTGGPYWFDNGDEPRQLHPLMTAVPSAERWKTDACAPLALVPVEVAPIWQRLADRSGLLGHTVAPPATVTDPGIHVLADGRVIRPVQDSGSRYVFTIPGGVGSVKLVSRFCIPADLMVADVRDTRRLGVRVSWISVRANDIERVIPPDHPDLTLGWSDPETDGTDLWRWTDGDAAIPWSAATGPAVLVICGSPAQAYPVDPLRQSLAA